MWVSPCWRVVGQVIAKMKRAHLDLVQMVSGVFVQSDVPHAALEPLRRLETSSAAKEGAWFNAPANFESATAALFEARSAVFGNLKQADTWPGAVRAATMCAREDEHEVAIEILKKAPLEVQVPASAGWKLRLATWMVARELTPPWIATFLALDDASLAPHVAPLIAHDALVVGKRVLALEEGYGWKSAVVTRAEDAVDVTAGGWKKIAGLRPTHALVVASGGAGALLRAASAQGRDEMVDALLAAGVSALVADEGANTALHLAAAAGHVRICRALLAAGADGAVGNAQWQTADDLAVRHKQLAVARLFRPTLSDKEFTDAACTATPRLRAAAEGDVAALEGQDEGTITALMVASRSRQLAVVEALAHADVNAQSESGCTALYLAAEEGDSRIVALLLARGADVSVAASDGRSCLQCACYFGHEEVIRSRLLSVDMCIQRLRIFHASHHHEQVARELLEAGAAVDYMAENGPTALMLAAADGHEQVSSTR